MVFDRPVLCAGCFKTIEKPMVFKGFCDGEGGGKTYGKPLVLKGFSRGGLRTNLSKTNGFSMIFQ